MTMMNLVDTDVRHKYQLKLYGCVTLYNFLIGNFWKAPIKSVIRKIDYQSEMIEPDKYTRA